MVQLSTRKALQLFLFTITLLAGIKAAAQTYVNGNLSTGANNSVSVAAPAGYTWSELQTGNGNTGFGANIASSITLIDDFIVPVGQIWNITGMTFYAYSTGYSADSLTSPFNDLRLQLYNTDPSTGAATPVFGDLTNNRFGSSANALMYRVGNGATGITRKIWSVNGTISTTLNPGHYWIEYQLGVRTGLTSNFTPTSTVVGTVTQPGNNAWQHDFTANTWTGVIDQTSSTRQDLHFKINYTITTPPVCSGTPIPGATLSTVATACQGLDFTLSLQNNPLVSGISYIWQSSADGTSWNDISGATGETYSTSQTASTYYRALVTCGGNSVTSTPILVNLYSTSIITQPASISVGCSESASFTFAIGGTSPVLEYQWQQRASSISPWTNVSNTSLINGANNDTLTLMQVTTALNGYQFRAAYLDTCLNVYYSDSAILTATAISAAVTPSSATICGNTAQSLKLIGIQTTLASFNAPAITPPAGNIPDTIKAGVTNSLTVSGIPAGATVTGISVKFNLSHSYAGDLAIALKSPNNSIINLDYYLSGTTAGPSASGFVNTVISSNGSAFLGDSSDPYTGYFRADRVLVPSTGFPTGPTSVIPNTDSWSAMYTNPNGSWILGMYDGFTGDEGSLVSWSMDISYTLPATAAWTTSAAGTIYNDPAATSAYTTGTQKNIIYVKPTSNANYTAITSNNLCGNSAPATVNVTVVEAISNLIGPSNNTVCSGTNAAFLVLAGTGSNITYQWQVSTDGGTTWLNIPGATASSYLLTGVTIALDNNKYRALLSNGCGNPVTSVVGTLSVLTAPNITAQPNNTSACAGSTASFSVTAAGLSNSYQWQVSTDGGLNWSNITGATSATYSFTAGNTDNNNSYRATITTCSNSSNSTPATLTIVSSAIIITQPSNTTVCQGTLAAFYCDATGSSYQWQVSTDNGATWTDISGETTTTLQLPNTTSVQNNNQYRLVIGSCGTNTINSSAAILQVNVPASITVQPVNVSACNGTNASFSITASGNNPTYQWQVSTDGGTNWSDIAGATSSAYQLTNVSLTDNNNRYRVIILGVSPCSDIASAEAILSVNPIPTVSGSVTPANTVCQGTNVTFTGSGADAYSWSNGITDGVTFPANASQTYTVTGTTNGCSATADVSITVNPNPVVTISANPGTTLSPGTNTVITASSVPAATTYIWYLNNQVISGATGNSISVSYNSQNDLGNYYAMATDANGCSGESAAITIVASNQAFISPNPASGFSFSVNLPVLNGTTVKRIVSLYDSKGALVYQKSFNVSGAGRMDIITAPLSRGVYVVEVTDAESKRLKTDKVLIIGY